MGEWRLAGDVVDQGRRRYWQTVGTPRAEPIEAWWKEGGGWALPLPLRQPETILPTKVAIFRREEMEKMGEEERRRRKTCRRLLGNGAADKEERERAK